MPGDSPRSPRSCDTKPAREQTTRFWSATAIASATREADRRSAELARGLIALGAGKGTHVGLLYPNGTEFVVGMLAAARIGAVVIPFSTFATAREMREQLVDSDVEILLSAASFRSHDYVQRLTEVVCGLGFRYQTIGCSPPPHRNCARSESATRRTLRSASAISHVFIGSPRPSTRLFWQAMEDDVDGSDPLTIVYTSGSTSTPKGVVHTHAALLGHQQNLNKIRGLTANDKLFCNSPFFWIGGFAFGLLATLVAGSTLVCSNASRSPVRRSTCSKPKSRP